MLVSEIVDINIFEIAHITIPVPITKTNKRFNDNGVVKSVQVSNIKFLDRQLYNTDVERQTHIIVFVFYNVWHYLFIPIY